MSRPIQEAITCPKCGKDSEFTIWHSINTMLDPELKSAVRDRSIFRFNCPYCGHSAQVDYGFLYHQMEDQIIIHYAQSDKNVKEIYDLYSGKTKIELLKDLPEAKYLNRIVRSMNQLLEKIAIFDAKMDDRIVEICKVFIQAEYHKQHPESAGVEMLMYTDDEQNHIIQILEKGKTTGATQLTDEFYNMMKQEFIPRLKDIRDDREPIIDQAWALRFLSAK